MPSSPDSPNRLLIVASTNNGKIHEVRAALQDLSEWTVEAIPPELPDIEETGTTFLENAALKAAHYSRLVDGLVVADDSGLSVAALAGRPGIYSARYGTTAEARNQRVLDELHALPAGEAMQRDAAFHCVFAAARAGTILWSTEALLAGRIAAEPAGDFGFGFDPIFFVPELRKTLAQLTTEEKNRISARGQALVKLRRFLEIR